MKYSAYFIAQYLSGSLALPWKKNANKATAANYKPSVAALLTLAFSVSLKDSHTLGIEYSAFLNPNIALPNVLQ
jgi:hypothetical protein